MTRVVRDRILKDANGDTSDHLCNHIHLTNCIHLKNHIHKQSPIQSDRSIMRDLVVLQKSRSLRDPSMSPPSWNSPSAINLLSRRGEKDALVGTGRRSLGIQRRRDDRELFGSSSPLANLLMSNVACGEVIKCHDDVLLAGSDCSRKSVMQERGRSKREESVGRIFANDLLRGKDETLVHGNDIVHDTYLGDAGLRSQKLNEKGKCNQDSHRRTLPKKVHEVRDNNDDLASFHNYCHGRHAHYDDPLEDALASINNRINGRYRGKRRKFRGARKALNAVASKDVIAQNEISVASNSLAHGAANTRYYMEERGDEYDYQNVSSVPRNGCGIHWNWSQIHQRGKSFLDSAGRSLSCDLSDSKSRKGGPPTSEGEFSNMHVRSDHSSSSCKFSREASHLLIDYQDSTDNAAWVHDYSGELGVFADNLLKHDIDSDLASEARSGDQLKSQLHGNGRHENITQKYMPRTFRDLVGKSLISQALSNAVVKRKVGLLYVFYGPHGTGKTSCARIFARAINCLSMEHSKPCGVCVSCTAYDKGKNQYIQEIGPVSTFAFQTIVDLLNSTLVHRNTSQYRVLIFEDCDTIPTECWSSMSKVINQGPRRVVFVLVSSSLHVLPHMIISRCQKFFFSKLKDADIIYTLQWIATKEGLEIDKDALKLIASRSDGSLRDAEMTLDQFSLLGQRISISLVQELVGLVSDEKLVDLLDLAFSADTVNVVKKLREIMESGIEPLALMSQLATIITDILAGSYDIMKGRHRRKFFRRQALSKDDMKKLRHALKTLSEAEKQLRMSNDRLTWLTAALLQLAPDQQYNLPSFSADASFNQSPLALDTAKGNDRSRISNVEHTDIPNTATGSSTDSRINNLQSGGYGNTNHNTSVLGRTSLDRNEHDGSGMIPQQKCGIFGHNKRVKNRVSADNFHDDSEEIWLEVLQKIHIKSIREFLRQEGKLVRVSFGAGSTVCLAFSSHPIQSKAEKFMTHILRAFEYVLGSPVKVEIICESRMDTRTEVSVPLLLPAYQDNSLQTYATPGARGINRMPMARYDDNHDTSGRNLEGDYPTQPQPRHLDLTGIGRSEIVEIEASPRQANDNAHLGDMKSGRQDIQGAWVEHQNSVMTSLAEQKQPSRSDQSRSIVRKKVSLAQIIQRVERGSQQTRWSRRKAVSIAEKLEQENLRLEPRSRTYLCWKASELTRKRLSRLKVRQRKPKALLKFMSCGKCMSARSSR